MKRERMFALVEQWQRSGQTQKAFLADKDIKPATFSYWRKKHLQAQFPTGGFSDIQPEVQSSSQVEVLFPSGARVILPKAEVGLIRSLVQ
jgi:hypothetical protein